MSTNRIQKLLFSEYCDFEDMVLVESPFAETNREGKGLRQVHMGLTPSKLVLATEILPLADDSAVLYMPGLDPEIETLELVAVYPIDCVNLSVFHRRKRQALKARFCNNNVMYFELGGFEKRNMFWNLWCEKIKFLSPEERNFSHSETSVATSTSNSTLYLVSTKKYTNGGASQIWCQYAGGDFARVISDNDPPKWPDKHLYLGSDLTESPLKYTPIQCLPSEEEFLKKKKCDETQTINTEKTIATELSQRFDKPQAAINRFSSGVVENCNTGLFLSHKRGKTQDKFLEMQRNSLSTCNLQLDHFSTQSLDINCLHALIHNQPNNFLEVANSAVRLWEMQNSKTSLSIRTKHRRRYAFAPHPHFYRGLGPWNVNQGERFTLQMKRAVSMVCIKRQPLESELRLSVSRRQLVASISFENLCNDRKVLNSSNHNTIRNSHKSPVIFFWTPDYWYRPLSAREVYQELQFHLHKIHEYHQIKDTIMTKFFRKKRKISESFSTSLESESESPSQNYFQKVQKSRKGSIMHRIVTKRSSHFSESRHETEPRRESSVQFLKRVLRMEISLSAWDFDSNVLATQLTLIDRDLFVKILPEELSILLWQQSSKNASNIGALIAFSHRISCLVCTEILKDDTEKIRARLITRFINIAEKCNSINNYQSCRSILSGLQSPPIYRLHSTWNYVRKRHSSRYEVFENLCRLYRDARLPSYQNSFHHASRSPIYMPFIGDIIAKLLDIVPSTESLNIGLNSKSQSFSTNSSRGKSETNSLGLKISVKRKSHTNLKAKVDQSQSQSLFRKIVSSLKVWHADDNNPSCSSESFVGGDKKKRNDIDDYKTVANRYKELYFYEDNRQERLKECMKLLMVHQNAAARYNYPQNDLAKEYLLKARYREDQANFMQSLIVEPFDM